MAYYSDDEDEDLLALLADKDNEIESLHEKLGVLLGSWLFAERHGLTIEEIIWMERNKIEAASAPDGGWDLSRCGKRLQHADGVKKALAVLRAFSGEKLSC